MALLLKLTLAPALVALATYVARRLGPRAGGMVSGIPVVAGPIVLIYAIEHGDRFARPPRPRRSWGCCRSSRSASSTRWSRPWPRSRWRSSPAWQRSRCARPCLRGPAAARGQRARHLRGHLRRVVVPAPTVRGRAAPAAAERPAPVAHGDHGGARRDAHGGRGRSLGPPGRPARARADHHGRAGQLHPGHGGPGGSDRPARRPSCSRSSASSCSSPRWPCCSSRSAPWLRSRSRRRRRGVLGRARVGRPARAASVACGVTPTSSS